MSLVYTTRWSAASKQVLPHSPYGLPLIPSKFQYIHRIIIWYFYQEEVYNYFEKIEEKEKGR